MYIKDMKNDNENVNIRLFDTHTHYDDEAYGSEKERNELIESLLQNSINGFIAIGCSLERSAKAVKLAEKYPNCYAAIGIHPDDAPHLPPDYLETLKNFAKSEKVKAVGEIGLDYFYEGYDENIQKRVFKEQLELAAELKLPAVIHSRDATRDTLDILKEYNGRSPVETSRLKPKAVMHCFSGSAETAEILVKMGVMLSFTGVLTFKNAKRSVEACKQVPLNMLMLETDCPYLAPAPFRGKRCDSGMAWYTAQKIAQIKKRTTDEIVSICNKNAERFFGIKL